jgi:hypothetical protein
VTGRTAKFRAPSFWIVAGLLALVLLAGSFVVLLLGRGEQRLPLVAADITTGGRFSDPQFTAQLRQRFPPGSDVESLIDELQREKFSVDVAGRRAFFKLGKGWPCFDILTVEWQQDARRHLTAIDGTYRPFCI